ncbi:MAG: L-threonylcarbamoyladenylate synthase [Spirosomaceae bacterium]|jgi:L-threonylcarbamoyladenylate synthase|nr:L-threonylcarbamoyladenylate synthase [Spirosomataceae bacterium]
MAIIDKNIELAIEVLNNGDVVGIPTETVYGLAANALDVDAVTKIFEVKNRPTFDPLIIHTSSIDRISDFVTEVPLKAIVLAQKFMPGPLTLLLPKKSIIPDLVTSGLDNVAVRIPNHPLTLKLLNSLEFPLAAPSANPFGYISPTTALHVEAQLGDKIKYILDGGECNVGIESTIIGFVDDEVVVYRKGGLAIELIEEVVGDVRSEAHSTSNPQAPGMLKSHYSPRKKFVISEEMQLNERIAFLGFKNYLAGIPTENQLLLSPKGDFAEAAKNLFSYLRKLDAMDIDLIYGEYLPEIDLGRAINDRLRRATVQD